MWKKSQETALVIVSEPWRGGKTLNEPPYYVRHAPHWIKRYRIALWTGALLVAIALGYTAGNWQELHANVAPAIGRLDQKTHITSPVERKNDPSKVTFSDIEFNSMGRGNYFLHAVITNASNATYDWPLIKVTFVSGGRDIAEKTIPPLEYLAGEIAAGRTPSPSLAPKKSTPVWMHLAISEDVSTADSYRVSAQYPQRSSP